MTATPKFSEDDPYTWDDDNLPEGYAWKWVDDIEMHLFTPSGFDLSVDER